MQQNPDKEEKEPKKCLFDMGCNEAKYVFVHGRISHLVLCEACFYYVERDQRENWLDHNHFKLQLTSKIDVSLTPYRNLVEEYKFQLFCPKCGMETSIVTKLE